MENQSFVFDGPIVDGCRSSLKMAAKRYVMSTASSGYTLIAFHGLGQHKEQWEPILDALHRDASLSGARIREAWAFDWQTHGDSAIFNREILKTNTKAAPLTLWAAAVAAFLTSERMNGHQLIGVAYSCGASALALCTRYLEKRIRFQALIFLEPAFADFDTWFQHRKQLDAVYARISRGTLRRCNSWASRDAASHHLQGQYPYNTWDPRALRLYVDEGLYECCDKDGRRHVQRKCSPEQEAAIGEHVPHTIEGFDIIRRIQHHTPVHLVSSLEPDIVPTVVRECIIKGPQAKRYASVTMLQSVGHMIMQQRPELTAKIIARVLNTPTESANTATGARL